LQGSARRSRPHSGAHSFWRSRQSEDWLKDGIICRLKSTPASNVLSWHEDELKALDARHPELAPTPAELETSRAQEAGETNKALLQGAQVREFLAARGVELGGVRKGN
jgi:hypothetical protein